MGRHRVKLVKFPVEKLPGTKAGPYQAAQCLNICAEDLLCWALALPCSATDD
jgi:hypothetical protein